MKIKGIFLLFLFASSLSINAQEACDHTAELAELETKRADFIVERMGLTADEAKKVTPLVNTYMKERFKVYREYYHSLGDLRKKKDKTEADYNALLDLYTKSEATKLDLELKFIADLRKLTSAEKAYKYRQAERVFMQKMVKRHKHKKTTQDASQN